MRSFWYEYLDDRIEIIFSLIKNGKWSYHYRTGKKIGVEFEYPGYEDGDFILISDGELEEMYSQTRSMLFQSLKIDAPEFGLAYS